VYAREAGTRSPSIALACALKLDAFEHKEQLRGFDRDAAVGVLPRHAVDALLRRFVTRTYPSRSK